MGIEASSFRFDQGGASNAYLPNIYGFAPSGLGGEPKIDVFLATRQTLGASKLAGIPLLEEMELLRNFSVTVSFQRGLPIAKLFKRGLSALVAELPSRSERISSGDADHPFRHLEERIRAAIEADPVEDGYLHPAEVFLEELLRVSGQNAGDWLIDVLSGRRWNGSLAAGLLRLSSRQKPLTKEWRLRVIQLALSSPNIELRDAAVQAAEAWEDPGAVQLLQAHTEPCAWLSDYVWRVIRDLTR